MSQLQRITLEYIEAEDRMRLSGQAGAGRTMVLWLTQRLLNRLVPRLCEWLEKQGRAGLPVDVVQGFAQQAAMAALTPQAPVKAAPEASAWLVTRVDLAATDRGYRLRFIAPDPQDEPLDMLMSAQQMRQWLGVMHKQYLRGGWPLVAWPDWLLQAGTPAPPPAAAVRH